ncbi:hypothetical protein [Labilibaculum antarcticum]|uniref:Uncharacterized protein n=1 Tax=Labilibaculum antarcticum TaxID=1717717 RepID=A0A1Y1CFG6_9BACT|nr:hypothetical protein [Labilibaculum antarcticum]BAX79054.1 hypothetical protein ALGA_0665 [Labilibaculum antarcticum]
MREIVLKTLEQITKEKEDARKFPTHVMYVELINELGREINPVLRELLNEGKIKAGNTINDKFIKLLK